MCFLRTVAALFALSVFAFGQHAPAPVTSDENPVASGTIVIGFVGGFVGHEDSAHTTVQLTEHLRKEYPTRVYARTFENHSRDKALKEILQRLDVDNDGTLSLDEKQNARIIILGHSWGGSETVTLARKLQKIGIPVLLTVQVDSVSKPGENDALIPANVQRAANFFQPDGLIHGNAEIRAADPARTRILGNFRFDYKSNPVACQGYSWFGRLFMKHHIEIECDPKVWDQVESLVDSSLFPQPHTLEARF